MPRQKTDYQASTPARLERFFSTKGVSLSSIEALMGVSNGRLGKIIKEGSSFGIDIAEKLISIFPDLNPTWLLTGSGPMLLGDAPTPPLPTALTPFEYVQGPTIVPAGNFGAVTIRLRNDAVALPNAPGWIPLVPIRARAGYIRQWPNADPNNLHEIQLLYAPHLNTRTGMLRAFEIEGDSMESTFKDGDIVIGERLESPAQIRSEKAYIVVTPDDMLIKRVFRKGDLLTLKSDNKYYDDQHLELSEVKEMWREVGVLITSPRYYPRAGNGI